LGISLIRFGVDDILNTTELIDSQGNIDYNRISLSTADYGFTFSLRTQTACSRFSIWCKRESDRRIIGKFCNSWGLVLMWVQFEKTIGNLD
jgi:hypothetical protein